MDKVSQLLIVLLFVVLFILFVLIVVWMVLKIKTNKDERQRQINLSKQKKSKVQQEYDVQSIFDFMEFDKIEDNMIIQNQGRKFLMIVKCQGINYDLMSGIEKTSVEQGFLQYLNALRYQVQIYVQTRTVDLGSSIDTYKEKVKKIGDRLVGQQLEYNKHEAIEDYPQEELFKERREIAKTRNLYEYGTDIINNTERVSLNKNILSKQYYVVIPFYAEELGTGDYSKEEVENMAFSELYTRAQSTISLLSVCGVVGKILDSFDLTNLLYMAYNRDEAEVYDLKKMLNSRYDEMYTTAPDVLDKKMAEIDKKIEEKAILMANNAVLEVKQDSEKERQIKYKQDNFEEAVKELAKIILDENRGAVGIRTAEKAKEKIDSKNKKTKAEKKEAGEDGEKQAKVRKAGRPRKVS